MYQLSSSSYYESEDNKYLVFSTNTVRFGGPLAQIARVCVGTDWSAFATDSSQLQ